MESILKKRKNKKGDGFISWFFILAVLLALSIFLLVANYSWGQIQEPLTEGLSGVVDDDVADQINNSMNQTAEGLGFFDNLLPFVLIGLFGFIAISAGTIMKSPIFIFIGIILIAVVFLLAGIYSNLYKSIIDTDEFSTTDDSLPIQNLLMRYLPLILIIAILLVVIFSALSSSGGGL